MTMQYRHVLAVAFSLMMTATANAQASSEQQVNLAAQQPVYALRPAEISLPADAKLGKYRRVITPFDNWTLICDEDLHKKKKVCNISQTVEDQNANLVFSWSLAATDKGQPVMVLRTKPILQEGDKIKLDLGDGGSVVDVAIQGCTEAVCLGYQNAGPRIRSAVKNQNPVDVMITPRDGQSAIRLKLPLKGLDEALNAI